MREKLLPRKRSSDAFGCILAFGGGGDATIPLGCCPIIDGSGGGGRSKKTSHAYFFVVVASVDADARGWMLPRLLMVVHLPSSEVGCSGSRFVCQR